jgi:hypothetical protein
VNAWQKGMMACQEVTKTFPDMMEANPEEMKSELVHEEVPKEEVMMTIVTALNKWYRDRHLAVRCHGQPKKWTQGNGGSQKKLAAYQRMTCTA